MSTLHLHDIGKRYGRDSWALRDISFSVENGVLGLVGPNGAGKTTLLRILATLLAPSTGTVMWDDHDVIRSPVTLRQSLGYVPQDFGVYPQLTAREFLRYLAELKGLRGAVRERRVGAVLESVRLDQEADRRLREFSGGMIRRVGIAQALLNEPRVLILDEPTVGLDPNERVRFRETLAALPGERLIVLSTHIISDVEATANHLALLGKGRLMWSGSTEELLADAEGACWSLTLSAPEFERVRARTRVSVAVPHGTTVNARVLARERPHPEALPATPSLEEAYLLVSEEATGQPSVPVVAVMK